MNAREIARIIFESGAETALKTGSATTGYSDKYAQMIINYAHEKRDDALRTVELKKWAIEQSARIGVPNIINESEKIMEFVIGKED